MNGQRVLAGVVVCFSLFSTRAWADEPAIRKAVEAYIEAFNKKDLKAIVANWTEKAVHVDRETGERTEGKGAIEADLSALFKARPGAKLSGQIERVRLIRPDVASVEGETLVSAPGAEPSRSVFTAILVKEKEKWLIDSIEESPLPKPATAFDALRPLEWLVGRWVEEADGTRVETTVRWSSEKTFLLRTFTVASADGVEHHGTQVIGYDPRADQIRSWLFNSDGSFGDGVWSGSGGEWSIKSSQTLADGRAASGTYVLSKEGTNSLTLHLIGHEIEGEPQPASKPVTMTRVLDEKKPAAAEPKPPTTPAPKRP